MHVISKKAIDKFTEKHTAARGSLLAWHKLAEHCHASNLAELRATFGSVDYVPPLFHVFNVAGNSYRIVAEVNFVRQKLFIRHVLTHEEYDEWTRKNRGK